MFSKKPSPTMDMHEEKVSKLISVTTKNLTKELKMKTEQNKKPGETVSSSKLKKPFTYEIYLCLWFTFLMNKRICLTTRLYCVSPSIFYMKRDDGCSDFVYMTVNFLSQHDCTFLEPAEKTVVLHFYFMDEIDPMNAIELYLTSTIKLKYLFW